MQYLDRPYKDEISKSILDCLKNADTDINSKHCSILLLLNNVLKPTKVTRIFKPSVLVAQEDVILFAATDDDASATLDKFMEEYTKHGFQPVPKLIAIGENVTSLDGEFQVRYKNFTYRFNTLIRAIDVLLKCSAVFGLEHSRISSSIEPNSSRTISSPALPNNLEHINRAAVAFTLELHNETNIHRSDVTTIQKNKPIKH
ncbi:uncharacterized protein LOC134214054 [Armigeres subalbatus]|uniref:uncharacterized protein LOC134214054 n=1 Tax=Armigeres subalbatus TaxID=124917 RepID=UPI002ED3B9C6